MTIPEVISEIAPYRVRHALLTGGEPLLQRQTSALLDALNGERYQVSIETHGEVSIRDFAGRARIVMDIKTPSSGMSRGGFRKNLQWLKQTDEIKFVIGSGEDYDFARNLIETGLPTGEVLLSPAMPAMGSPGSFPGVTPKWLAERVLEDHLPVRVQIQLHKYIWGSNTTGV